MVQFALCCCGGGKIVALLSRCCGQRCRTTVAVVLVLSLCCRQTVKNKGAENQAETVQKKQAPSVDRIAGKVCGMTCLD